MTLRLGELLIQKKLLSQTELEMALDEQRRTGDFLGHVLLRRGYVKETDLIKAFSEHFKIPFVNLKTEYVDWDLVMAFSASLIAECKCLPYRQTEYAITAAILNPLDANTISRLEDQANGKKVNLVLVTAEDMQEMLRQYQKRITAKINRLLDEEG